MRVALLTVSRLINLWPSNSGSNWNLEMLVFEERGKPEYPEKKLSEQGENQQQTQPTCDARGPFLESLETFSGMRSHF